MALYTCPECFRDVSEYADICQNCGYPIQEYIKNAVVVKCPLCGEETLNRAKECKLCGFEIGKYTALPEDQRVDPLEGPAVPLHLIKPTPHIPHCPFCSSTDLTKISAIGKAIKIELLGLYGADDLGKTYRCRNCGGKF